MFPLLRVSSSESKIFSRLAIKLLNILLALNSLSVSGEFCRLLTIFANSLDPDQARHSQNGGPDLGSSYLALILFLKECLVKRHVKK